MDPCRHRARRAPGARAAGPLASGPAWTGHWRALAPLRRAAPPQRTGRIRTADRAEHPALGRPAARTLAARLRSARLQLPAGAVALHAPRRARALGARGGRLRAAHDA